MTIANEAKVVGDGLDPLEGGVPLRVELPYLEVAEEGEPQAPEDLEDAARQAISDSWARRDVVAYAQHGADLYDRAFAAATLTLKGRGYADPHLSKAAHAVACDAVGQVTD